MSYYTVAALVVVLQSETLRKGVFLSLSFGVRSTHYYDQGYSNIWLSHNERDGDKLPVDTGTYMPSSRIGAQANRPKYLTRAL
jgi:hypothetical protein